jgi:hypothetical protein
MFPEYWSSLLGDFPKNSKAIKIAVGTVSKGGSSWQGFYHDETGKTILARAIFNDDTSKPLRDDSFGVLNIEKIGHEGFNSEKFYYAEPIKLLPNHKGYSLSATIVHEMGHLMGITSVHGSHFLYGVGGAIYSQSV